MDRLRFPNLTVAAHGGSGLIVGLQRDDFNDNDTDGAVALGLALRDGLTRSEHRLETIREYRARGAAMLAQVASQRRIPGLEEAEVVELNLARRRSEQYVERGR